MPSLNITLTQRHLQATRLHGSITVTHPLPLSYQHTQRYIQMSCGSDDSLPRLLIWKRSDGSHI